jgi:hypothetical protein
MSSTTTNPTTGSTDGGSHATPLLAGKAFTSANLDAVSNQDQFHAKAPRDHPMTTSGVSIFLPLFPAQVLTIYIHSTNLA